MEERKMFQEDEIKTYLSNLDFKRRVFGGCDKEDVFSKLAQLTGMYQERMRRLEEETAAAVKRESEQVDKIEAAEKEVAALKNTNEELQRKVEILEEEQKAQEDKIRLVTDMEVRQKLERNEILLRAEHEAKIIKERAEQDALTVRTEGRQRFVKEIREKRALLEKLNQDMNNQVCDMRSVLKITTEEFSKMQSSILNLEERLNAYPPAMFIAAEEEGEIYYVEQKE